MLRTYKTLGIRASIYGRAIPRHCRRYAPLAAIHNENEREGWLFVESVLPVRLATWDPRYYIGLAKEESQLELLQKFFQSVKTRGFECLSLDSRVKDGGVFAKFKYVSEDDDETALEEILQSLHAESEKMGGLPSWVPMKTGNVWLVKGKPWREDMHRFASPILKVAFEGPDIYEEDLYAMLRPFGKIVDISNPTPVPAGSLRSAIVTFRQVRSAIVAHNCMHGLSVPSSTSPTTVTRIHTYYERPLKAHAIRDWISSHPRIVIPVVVFLLGSLTYTIFDPIRALAVEVKMLDWLDFRQSSWYKWMKRNTIDRVPFQFAATSQQPRRQSVSNHGIWKERREADDALRAYLSDIPNAMTFVHGPQGSGKTHLCEGALKDSSRPYLVINCAELYRAASDSALIQSLARQTGYWPVFPFVNSLNNLIDIASVGLIGQKAGLSTSMEDQIKELLDVVATGLQNVSARQKQRNERLAKAEEARIADEARIRGRVDCGIWHDERLDYVTGNGIMSDFGLGDEMRIEYDGDSCPSPYERAANGAGTNCSEEAKPRNSIDNAAINTLPIVFIKNYATKRGKDEVLDVIAQWAGRLVENQTAHVVVMSDNRENAKQLTRALPSKPLNQIPLSDADADSALSFVTEKLRDAGVQEELSHERTKCIERLGGRASDLEILVHKVSNGQSVEEAVEDIIVRGVSELRKNAFGEDAEDAKSLAWSKEQAWAIIRALARRDEIAYHDILLDFPFKGDETPLRNMEHAELITIGTYNGRPSTIRPGRPVYRYVFERLVTDPVFDALQEIAFNEKLIASSEASVKSCEEELLKLKNIGMGQENWFGKQSGASARGAYLAKKLYDAEAKLEKLEAKNAELKKILAKRQ